MILPFREGVPAKIIDERQTVQLVDRELVLPGQPGDYLSLFSLTPETTGVFTKGLKYPLTGETLYFASTLGLSNKFVSAQARVTVASGLLHSNPGFAPVNRRKSRLVDLKMGRRSFC